MNEQTKEFMLAYLNAQLKIEKARLHERTRIWGELADKHCADDRAVVAEIEAQIYELEGEI